MNLAPIRKALVAAGAAAVFALASGLAAGLADGHLTGPESAIAAGLALAAAGTAGRATWQVKNTTT